MTYKVLIEKTKTGKREWLIIRVDVDGKLRAPRGCTIISAEAVS